MSFFAARLAESTKQMIQSQLEVPIFENDLVKQTQSMISRMNLNPDVKKQISQEYNEIEHLIQQELRLVDQRLKEESDRRDEELAHKERMRQAALNQEEMKKKQEEERLLAEEKAREIQRQQVVEEKKESRSAAAEESKGAQNA